MLVGTNHADVIFGGGGNDRIMGRGGKDIICGGLGNDYIDGGSLHDVDRGQAGHDTCVTAAGGGVDLYIGCEDFTAFDLQIDDALDWGFTANAAGAEPPPGNNVVTTIHMGAGGVGHAGYLRTLVAKHGLLSGTTTALDFGTGLDDGAVSFHLPFSVPFFGIPYDDISVSTNGWVAFGAPAWDYMDHHQFGDYRGFRQVVGQFDRGVMPYWGDLDLSNGGSGGGSVSVVTNPSSVAVQWNAGECCTGDPPHRVFQLVLFKNGRIRYDYVSSTSPDSDPNPAFIGLSDGTGPSGVNTFRRSPYTYLRANVTLPHATLPVKSTAGFKIPGKVQVSYAQQVTCTGKTATTLTGCTGGTGSFLAADRVSVHQRVPLPAKSILYTPVNAPTIAAPGGVITLTLPRGSSYGGADLACFSVTSPTADAEGIVRCSTSALALGASVFGHVTWTVPPNMGNGQGTPANVDLQAVFTPTGSPRSIDYEETLFAGDPRPTTMTPTLTYTGPSPAHVINVLTFHVTSGAGANLAFPVLDITIPAGFHLFSTTFPACGSLAGFGGGSVTCSLPNGAGGSYSGDLTFQTNAAGTYKPKVTYFAENAPTASKTATLIVSP